uniref:Uncharacterized protein n=1 Tax=Brassica oleracea TaxID=3712 RepID=A0A3P6F5N2_BRAOL|nr:unnamed protein product [Brassica oleracea]
MKLISLMCIAFVILLTSFPATAIKFNTTFNTACLKNHDTCGPLAAVKGRRWRPECCKFWSGNGSQFRGSFPGSGQAAGRLHPGGYVLSPKVQYPLRDMDEQFGSGWRRTRKHDNWPSRF